MKNPIFILGCPRSGTTMLANLLRKSRFGEPIETHFITKYYKKLDSYGKLEIKTNLDRLLKDIFSERPIMQWGIPIDVDTFYEGLEDFSYSNIVHNVCMLRSRSKGYASWGDKTPHYTLDLSSIYKLFPESKYVFIIRDGRDVALSLLRQPWGPNNFYSCAHLWKAYNAPNDTLDEIKSKGRLYFVRYEDLLDNAERIIPEIYAFLEEKYDEHEVAKLIGKINKENYNKWKKRMNSSQIELFENIAADTLNKYGYETNHEEKDISGITKNMFRLHESLMKANFLFKHNVIDTIKIKLFGKEPFAE